MSNWRDWHGGDCPTDRDAKVRLRFRNGWESPEDRRAGNFVWRHRGWEFDITEFQVVDVPQEAKA